MQAYFCDAGQQDIIVEVIDYWPRTEPAYLCDIIIAESRGKAKSMFLALANKQICGWIEYTDIKIRLISPNVVNHPAGAVAWNDPLWDRTGINSNYMHTHMLS